MTGASFMTIKDDAQESLVALIEELTQQNDYVQELHLQAVSQEILTRVYNQALAALEKSREFFASTNAETNAFFKSAKAFLDEVKSVYELYSADKENAVGINALKYSSQQIQVDNHLNALAEAFKKINLNNATSPEKKAPLVSSPPIKQAEVAPKPTSQPLSQKSDNVPKSVKQPTEKQHAFKKIDDAIKTVKSSTKKNSTWKSVVESAANIAQASKSRVEAVIRKKPASEFKLALKDVEAKLKQFNKEKKQGRAQNSKSLQFALEQLQALPRTDLKQANAKKLIKLEKSINEIKYYEAYTDISRRLDSIYAGYDVGLGYQVSKDNPDRSVSASIFDALKVNIAELKEIATFFKGGKKKDSISGLYVMKEKLPQDIAKAERFLEDLKVNNKKYVAAKAIGDKIIALKQKFSSPVESSMGAAIADNFKKDKSALMNELNALNKQSEFDVTQNQLGVLAGKVNIIAVRYEKMEAFYFAADRLAQKIAETHLNFDVIDTMVSEDGSALKMARDHFMADVRRELDASRVNEFNEKSPIDLKAIDQQIDILDKKAQLFDAYFFKANEIIAKHNQRFSHIADESGLPEKLNPRLLEASRQFFDDVARNAEKIKEALASPADIEKRLLAGTINADSSYSNLYLAKLDDYSEKVLNGYTRGVDLFKNAERAIYQLSNLEKVVAKEIATLNHVLMYLQDNKAPQAAINEIEEELQVLKNAQTQFERLNKVEFTSVKNTTAFIQGAASLRHALMPRICKLAEERAKKLESLLVKGEHLSPDTLQHQFGMYYDEKAESKMNSAYSALFDANTDKALDGAIKEIRSTFNHVAVKIEEKGLLDHRPAPIKGALKDVGLFAGKRNLPVDQHISNAVQARVFEDERKKLESDAVNNPPPKRK